MKLPFPISEASPMNTPNSAIVCRPFCEQPNSMQNYGFPYMTFGSTPSTPFVSCNVNICPYFPNLSSGNSILFSNSISTDFGSAYQNTMARLAGLTSNEQIKSSLLPFQTSTPVSHLLPNLPNCSEQDVYRGGYKE